MLLAELANVGKVRYLGYRICDCFHEYQAGIFLYGRFNFAGLRGINECDFDTVVLQCAEKTVGVTKQKGTGDRPV